MFETGKIEHLLAAIDNIVNGEVNLPPGEQKKLFERIREVGKGYTIIGTNYTYNARNQLVHRENAIRYEEYDYTYDDAGNLLTDGRSKYKWNALGQLTKVTFPDGFGEKYAYDMLGRRISKTQFNHTGSTQEVTQYTYKGDTWAITEERDGSGNVTKSYTFDANDRPLTITLEGQTFWYVYNGHGEVSALTDKDGKVAARYEYDAWGLVSRMYNGLGERVREGTGWIGDLGTGNGSPGSVQGPEDGSGNTEPDYHPGNGNDAVATEGTDRAEAVEAASASESELSALLSEVDIEPSNDITTELVKENPYRYAGYYRDRKTQYYYLQARYYDPRVARFISEDTYEGEIENPQSLNQYVYVESNPLTNIDPSGHYCVSQNGNWAQPGYCNSPDSLYLGKDADFVGRPVINKGIIGGYIGKNGIPYSEALRIPGNYWKMYKDDYSYIRWVAGDNDYYYSLDIPTQERLRKRHLQNYMQEQINEGFPHFWDGVLWGAELALRRKVGKLPTITTKLLGDLLPIEGTSNGIALKTLEKMTMDEARTTMEHLLKGGEISIDELKKYIPANVPDTFTATSTIKDGAKFDFTISDGKRVIIRWHSPDTDVAIKIPSAVSGQRWTAQIKVGNKQLGTDGKWHKNQNLNEVHIPVKGR